MKYCEFSHVLGYFHIYLDTSVEFLMDYSVILTDVLYCLYTTQFDKNSMYLFPSEIFTVAYINE